MFLLSYRYKWIRNVYRWLTDMNRIGLVIKHPSIIIYVNYFLRRTLLFSMK